MKLLCANLAMSSRGCCLRQCVPLAWIGAIIGFSSLLVPPVGELVLGGGLLASALVAYFVAGICSFAGIRWAAAFALLSAFEMQLGQRYLSTVLSFLGWGFLVMAPLGQLVTPLLMWMWPETFTDALEERVEHFCSLLGEYDVVCLQEVTCYWGFDSVAQDIMKAGSKHGLSYASYSGRWPAFPSTFCNGGLLILSRYPIVRSEVHVFARNTWFEWSVVQKGYVMVEMEGPSARRIALANVHTTCGHVLKQTGEYLRGKCGAGDGSPAERNTDDAPENQIGLDQMREALAIFQRFAKGTDDRILCGDFNLCKVSSPTFKLMRKSLESAGLADCYPDCPPTFGCDDETAETFLTPPNERFVPKVLDHVFSDFKCFSAEVEALRAPERFAGKFQQVSDHKGVVVAWA